MSAVGGKPGATTILGGRLSRPRPAVLAPASPPRCLRRFRHRSPRSPPNPQPSTPAAGARPGEMSRRFRPSPPRPAVPAPAFPPPCRFKRRRPLPCRHPKPPPSTPAAGARLGERRKRRLPLSRHAPAPRWLRRCPPVNPRGRRPLPSPTPPVQATLAAGAPHGTKTRGLRLSRPGPRRRKPSRRPPPDPPPRLPPGAQPPGHPRPPKRVFRSKCPRPRNRTPTSRFR
jgi:hypothetical protein